MARLMIFLLLAATMGKCNAVCDRDPKNAATAACKKQHEPCTKVYEGDPKAKAGSGLAGITTAAATAAGVCNKGGKAGCDPACKKLIAAICTACKDKVSVLSDTTTLAGQKEKHNVFSLGDFSGNIATFAAKNTCKGVVADTGGPYDICAPPVAKCATVKTTAGFCGSKQVYDASKDGSNCAAKACATAADAGTCCKAAPAYCHIFATYSAFTDVACKTAEAAAKMAAGPIAMKAAAIVKVKGTFCHDGMKVVSGAANQYTMSYYMAREAKSTCAKLQTSMRLKVAKCDTKQQLIKIEVKDTDKAGATKACPVVTLQLTTKTACCADKLYVDMTKKGMNKSCFEAVNAAVKDKAYTKQAKCASPLTGEATKACKIELAKVIGACTTAQVPIGSAMSIQLSVSVAVGALAAVALN